MNRSTFWVVVLGLAGFLGWVAVKSNRLPEALAAEIQQERKLLDGARGTIAGERDTIAKQAAAEPELFHVQGFDQAWPARLAEAGAALNEADRYAVRLEALRQKNSKSTRVEVEDLLRRERERIGAALTASGGVMKEAGKRAALKANFAQTLNEIESGSKTLESADLTGVTAKVRKAEQDWPSHKDDLESRLNALLNSKKQAGDWEREAAALKAKPPAQLTAADYAQALDAKESLESIRGGATNGPGLAVLSQQLYTSWDNILEDLDQEHGVYRERVKHIATVVSAPGDKGVTSSDTRWLDVPQDQWHLVENDLGMTIGHKPLGKFDSEASLTAEPPGFAYVASPQEGRNRYGYWENNGGGSFWHWLPEYLILRDLLSNRSYQPIPSYEWDRYRMAQRSGQTWYGQDAGGAPKYGSHGTFTAQHYGNSRYVQSGGFSGSKYASGGGFSGSKYGNGGASASTPSTPGPKRFGGSSGRSFGSGARSPGRSFGRRR